VTVGLLHPGQMGASVAAAARAGGAKLLFASQGRTEATRERAARAELSDVGTLEALVAASEIVLSVCPPHAALDLARSVAALDFSGLYVDANAVAPASARRIGEVVGAAGARFVDGGIVGPPAWRAGSTTLWLSGQEAERVAALFEGTALAAEVLDGGPGAASALKVCFAAWTKGSSALLLAVRALAHSEGVDGALVRQWERMLPDLPARSEGTARTTAPKAWRFVGEMHEIAQSFADADLPDGFHRAAAEVYAALERFKDTTDDAPLDEVVRALLDRTDASSDSG
jgi:3-hydroxyisobutyrate dehydrogenase-like beta-hydroxyacid dehydrogenase